MAVVLHLPMGRPKKTTGAKRNHVTLRVTDEQLELLRAAAAAVRCSITDLLLSGSFSAGADITTRWPSNEWTLEMQHAVKAFQRAVPCETSRFLRQVARVTEDIGIEVLADSSRAPDSAREQVS